MKIRGGIFTLLLATLAGCGGGADTTQNINTGASGAATAYTGPPPATADVQLFKLNVWDNLHDDNGCANCHFTGGQTPTFVRDDDINLAYADANPLVDLSSPADSLLVTKVAGGHNCWLTSNTACGDVITAYITAWAGGSVTSGGVQIELTPPPIKDPADSKNFPGSSALFASTVHPLLTANCAACHVESAPEAQAPFFASSDADVAYDNAKQKMDLDNPDNSRFVLRLREEFHNCWDPDNTGSSDCIASADLMEAAITAFADQVPLTQVDPQLVSSKALTLLDGIVASGGSRHEDDVIALFQFKTGQGNTAFDTSGISPAMHLGLSGNTSWVGGYGIEFNNGRAQALTSDSKKLHDLIKATGEYSIEAWVVPANVTQEGPARIISYSAGLDNRNFTLGQTLYNYDFLHRSDTTSANGDPALSTADADEDLQATQQHVVVTFDPVNGRRIYVNGIFTDDLDSVPGGNLADWNDTYAFVLGNEVSGDRQWQGKLRLVAVHNRALTGSQVVQNFEAGVGEKFFLLFSVTDLVNVPDSYILFEVSQFDSYSYLFNAPRFISLDPAANPDGIPVAGMRIGINGKEALVGQAYRNLDTVISSSLYNTATGQALSPLGTVIALENGPSFDEFFLTFEVLGNNTNIVLEPAPLQPAAPADLPPSPDIGLRTFDEINATMSAVTQVPITESNVEQTFQTIKQQLPTVENIEGFLSAHQMAVSQLAIEYCNALIDDNGLVTRANYFTSFGFNETAGAAFDSANKRDLVILPLFDAMVGTGLTTQPDPADIAGELDSLMDVLTACAIAPPVTTCDTLERTEQIVKAACAATLGSGVTLIQ